MVPAPPATHPSKNQDYYRLLFENMLNGLAYCKMIFGESGQPADFIYLEVNRAFEQLTGLKDVVGRPVTELIPDIKQSNPELFEIYGRVALTGKPELFELEVKPLSRWFSISVYSPEKGYFVAVFDNITQRKQAEQALRDKLAELEKFNRLTIGRELQMVKLKERIKELERQVAQKPPPRTS
jgi:PAS domain S-box-containing protein